MNNLTVKDVFEVDSLIEHFYQEEIINNEERYALHELKDSLFLSRDLSLEQIIEQIRNQAYGV